MVVMTASKLSDIDYIEFTYKNVKTNTRRMQYSCEKCGKTFGSWKNLRQHKVESHSY